MNNKLLLFIFIGLLAIFGISKWLSGEGEGTFDPTIIQVDTAQVTKVVLHSRGDNFEEAVLEKKKGGWQLTKGKHSYSATADGLNTFLSNLSTVVSSRIVSKNAEKWAEYELQDGTSTHVEVFAGSKVLADFHVGKFSADPQAKQMTTYFRLTGKDDVYAVEGMAGPMLSQGSAAYRNKQVTLLEIGQVDRLNLSGDAVYNVERKGNQWMLDGQTPLDTTKVKHFLMNLRTMTGDGFVDIFDPAASQDRLLKTLTITGSQMPGDVTIRCWRGEEGGKPFVIQSSQYPQSWFSSDSTRLFTRVFKPVSEW